MIINNEALNESMFNYQLEMVNLRSSLEFDSAYVKYLGESDNIFIKIKDKIVAIIQRIINFIKDKLGRKTKEAKADCKEKAENPDKVPKKKVGDNKDKENKSNDPEELWVVSEKTLNTIYSYVEKYLNGELNKTMSNIDLFMDCERNKYTIVSSLKKYADDFKANGVTPPFGIKPSEKIDSSYDMSYYLKSVITKESGLMEAWIKDGKVTGKQISDFKNFDAALSGYGKELTDCEKLQNNLTKQLEKYKNDIKRIDLSNEESNMVTIFNNYNSSVLGTIDAYMGAIVYMVNAINYKKSQPVYI